MEKDDLPDVSFEGIPSNYLSDVPLETQRIVTTAFPEIRVLWNAKIWKYQLVCVAETLLTPYYDGQTLRGWVILPGDVPQNQGGDEMVKNIRARQNFNMVELKRLGFDSIEAYVDSWEPALKKAMIARAEEMAKTYDKLFERGLTEHDGVPMTFDRSRRLSEIDFQTRMDAMNPNRHLRSGKKHFSLTAGGVILPN